MKLQDHGRLTPLDPDTPGVQMADLETSCQEFILYFHTSVFLLEVSFRIPADILKMRRPRGDEWHLCDLCLLVLLLLC